MMRPPGLSNRPPQLPLSCALLVSALFALQGAGAAQDVPPSPQDAGAPDARLDAQPVAEPVEGSFLLGPEDVVAVFVWKEDELSTTATVRPDGLITLPLVGDLAAEGRTPHQLQEEIRQRLEKYIAVPVVTVMVQEINSRQISVLGEVRRPGRYRLGPQTTVLDAVAMGGGFTEFADRNKVTVLRRTENGVQRIPVHLKRMLRAGGQTFYLEPQDTVQVDG